MKENISEVCKYITNFGISRKEKYLSKRTVLI